MILSKNFTLEEFVVSQYAIRHDIDNTPPPEAVASLRLLIDRVLQPLRDILARPVIVTSGFRCEALNHGIGGSPTSQHRLGQAADLVVPGMSSYEVVKTIHELGLPYDQLIEEFGRWTHVSHCAIRRGETLRALRDQGKTKYVYLQL